MYSCTAGTVTFTDGHYWYMSHPQQTVHPGLVRTKLSITEHTVELVLRYRQFLIAPTGHAVHAAASLKP